MAIQNKDGIYISYACAELIEELENDLREFGDGNEEIYVVTEYRNGVKLYKDYNFMVDPEDEPDVLGHGFENLSQNESVEIITMSALLDKYKQQNSVI